MIRTAARAAAAAAGMTLVSMLIVGSFVGALHRPAPHQLPVGVAGPPAAAQQLGAGFAQHMPGAFSFIAYPDPQAARQAVLNRAVDAAVVLAPGQERLLVASGAGRFASQAVTGAFSAEAAAAGQHLTVTDIQPLPPGDQNGISPLFVFIGLVLPSAGFGIALAAAAGKRLSWAARLAALAGFAMLAGLAASWVADGMTGALPGAPLALAGLCALTAFAVATACAAAWRLAGPALAAMIVLLIVPVGVPAAGGPFGGAFVTSWYAHLGAALPAGAAMPAIRDIISFGGHALAGPLLVLGLWAGLSAIVLAIPPLPGRGHRTAATVAAAGHG